MMQVFVLLICLYIQSATSSLAAKYDYFKSPVKPCRIGDVVQNECIKCLCTSKTVFECLPLECDKDKIVEEKNVTSKQICLPNQLYAKNLITCICNKDGKWPHKSCEDTFMSLPPSSVQHHKCDPDTYVVIDCNICRCGPDGEFISHRCTKNNCGDSSSRRNEITYNFKRSNVYSNCEAKTWYSVAACQFCYCVNENKLVCNTGNDESNKVGLGTYDMHICGKELLKEALELVPKEQINLKELVSNIKSTDQETTPKKNTTKKNKSKKKEKDLAESGEDNTTSKYLKKIVKKDNPDVPKKESASEEEITTPAANIESPEDNSPVEMIKTRLDNPGSSNSEYEEYSNEISIDLGSKHDAGKHPTSKKPDSNEEENVLRERTKKDLEYNGKTLKINLPSVLNKVFEMALRKSMVSLVADTACVPGATSKNGCNMCFCLKNGKLICTSKHCE